MEQQQNCGLRSIDFIDSPRIPGMIYDLKRILKELHQIKEIYRPNKAKAKNICTHETLVKMCKANDRVVVYLQYDYNLMFIVDRQGKRIYDYISDVELLDDLKQAISIKYRLLFQKLLKYGRIENALILYQYYNKDLQSYYDIEYKKISRTRIMYSIIEELCINDLT